MSLKSTIRTLTGYLTTGIHTVLFLTIDLIATFIGCVGVLVGCFGNWLEGAGGFLVDIAEWMESL